jgi:hypothetical protein
VDIAWGDVLDAALSFFLIIVGVGIAYACVRLGGMFGRMSVSVVRVTDEVVPILSRAQTTVDGINLELERVDEIMVTAVHATKGAEKTVTTLSNAVAAPTKKASSWAAAAKEAMATFKARRAAGAEEAAPAETPAPQPQPAEQAATHPPPSPNGTAVEDDVPEAVRTRTRGPSLSQISWALPKRQT